MDKDPFIKYFNSDSENEIVSEIDGLVEVLRLSSRVGGNALLIRHSGQDCGLAFVPSRNENYYRSGALFFKDLISEVAIEDVIKAYKTSIDSESKYERMSVYTLSSLGISFGATSSATRPLAIALVDGEVLTTDRLERQPHRTGGSEGLVR